MNTKELRTFIDQEKGKMFEIERTINEKKNIIKQNEQSLLDHSEALEILKKVALKTQQQLKVHISEIVTLAMNAVLEDPYEFVVNFVEKRGKTECELKFFRDGKTFDPLEEAGGGAIDIASLALRIASWTMENPRKSNTIILDEPLKNLNEGGQGKQEKASMIIKELSKKLNIQFIIITHEDSIASYGDRTFNIKKIAKVSQVTQE